MEETHSSVLSATEVESAALTELKSILNRSMLKDSIMGVETIDGVTTETRAVYVSPKLADLLLQKNLNNRPVTNSNVNKLAASMTKGEWKFDGTPINFDKYANLLNGQHRLSAIIKSNTTQIMKVMTGLPSEIFATMDIGKIRTSAEILAIAGVENFKICSQASNFIHKFKRGVIGEDASKSSRHQANPNTGLSHPELLKFVASQPLIKQSVEFYLGLKKRIPINVMPNYMIAGLYFIFAEKDVNDAELFLTRVLTGENLEMDSPLFHLRNRLVNSKSDKTKRLYHNETVKLSIMAWNKFRNNEKVKNLKIPDILPKVI